MAGEQLSLFDDSRLRNPRIDQLPSGEPVEGDFIPYWSLIDNRTKKLSAGVFHAPPASSIQDFNWRLNRTDLNGDPWPYALNELTVRGGNWYQSLVENNVSVPGAQGNTTWLLMTRAVSGGFWKAGVYTEERPWVFSDHTGTTSIYELKDPTRPFKSTDIVAETNSGKWVSMSGKVNIEVITTALQTITLDMKFSSQRWFKGEPNIETNKFLSIINEDNAVGLKLLYTVSGLHWIEMEDNVRMSDPRFDPVTKQLQHEHVGDYELSGIFDGSGFWYLTLNGPFGGGGNTMPTVFDNIIGDLGGNMVGGPYSYFDAEGDPENNYPPEARNVEIESVNNNPGTPITASYEFYSHSGYAEGAHRKQFYYCDNDGSNKIPIAGETDDEWTPPVEDVGKSIIWGIVPIQVAAPPANGNPEGVEVFSNIIVIQAIVEEVPEMLNLDEWYNQALVKGSWIPAENRAPVLGLNPGGYYENTDPATRATYDAVDEAIVYNGSRHLFWPVIASGSIRTYEFVGNFQIDSMAGSVNETLWSISLLIWLKVFKNSDSIRLRISQISNPLTPLVIQQGQPYAYRFLVTVGSFVEIDLHVNYDEETDTYLHQSHYVGTNTGTTWLAGTARRGVAHDTTPPVTEPFIGREWSGGLRVGSWLPTANDNVKKLWRRLRADCGY